MALITVRAAAERLGVAYSTLKRWIQHGPRAYDTYRRAATIGSRRLRLIV